MIGQQAAIISYIDDYKLLMIATLAALPLLIVFKRPKAVAERSHMVVNDIGQRMACYCNILLCYDSTREGRRALIQGAELAQQLGAETHLLAIVPSNDGSMVDPSEAGMREQERQIKEVLREGVERLAPAA